MTTTPTPIRACPWQVQPWAEGIDQCGHRHDGDALPPTRPEAFCSCLQPDGVSLLPGHLGTDDCCSGGCDSCGLRYCFGCPCSADVDDPREADGVDWGFSEPGGISALRASTAGRCVEHGCHAEIDPSFSYCPHCGGRQNPRKHDCPTCGQAGVLTDADREHGYQCDRCAAQLEDNLGAFLAAGGSLGDY